MPTVPPVLDDTRTSADATARAVLERVADQAVLDRAIVVSRRETTLPVGVQWRDHSVAAGGAGTAMLFAAADARWPDDGWDRVGHRHLSVARTALETMARPPTGLFTGLAGAGLAAVALDRGRGRYRRFLAAVDAAVAREVGDAVRRLDAADGCGVGAFDLISGLTGVGAYLLTRGPAAAPPLRGLLGGLTRLLGDEREPRRWHTPPALAAESMLTAYPDGCHNCGLAHGVPGPLALLALAVQEGVEVAGMADAVRVAARWLAARCREETWGPEWPNAVALGRAPAPGPGPGRAAWCYGTPGVARALWLAGTAVRDASLTGLAVRAMLAVAARSPAGRGLTGPTYCHGRAGLLAVTARFAVDTGREEFAAAAAGLVLDLVDAFEPGSLLGYRSVEPGGVQVDHPGLLDGAPGVALALLTTDTAAGAPWHRLFLLG